MATEFEEVVLECQQLSTKVNDLWDQNEKLLVLLAECHDAFDEMDCCKELKNAVRAALDEADNESQST